MNRYIKKDVGINAISLQTSVKQLQIKKGKELMVDANVVLKKRKKNQLFEKIQGGIYEKLIKSERNGNKDYEKLINKPSNKKNNLQIIFFDNVVVNDENQDIKK